MKMIDLLEVALLKKFFKNIDSCIIALSGGFDSAVVAYLAKTYLGENKVIAATCVNNHIFRYQIRNALEIAKKLNIQWIPFYVHLSDSTFYLNDRNRCYICKKGIIKKLIDIKNDLSLEVIIDGTKKQDLNEDRPGLAALKEYSVISPMLEPDFDPIFIIHAKKFYNYSKINFISDSCKATRIMEGPITGEKITLVENIEDTLRDSYSQIRARIYNDYISIENKNNNVFSETEKKDILFKIRYLVDNYSVTFNNK